MEYEKAHVYIYTHTQWDYLFVGAHSSLHIVYTILLKTGRLALKPTPRLIGRNTIFIIAYMRVFLPYFIVH